MLYHKNFNFFHIVIAMEKTSMSATFNIYQAHLGSLYLLHAQVLLLFFLQHLAVSIAEYNNLWNWETCAFQASTLA